MLLGLGTIVTLKFRKKLKVCIIGYNPVVENTKYEYSGVVYPFGFVKDGSIISFNSEQIDEILHQGFTDSKHELMNNIISTISSVEESF